MKINDKENLLSLEMFFRDELGYSCYWKKGDENLRCGYDSEVLIMEVTSVKHMIKFLSDEERQGFEIDKILNDDIPMPDTFYKRFGLIPMKDKDYERYGLGPKKPPASFFKGMSETEIQEYYDGVKAHLPERYKAYGLSLGFRPNFRIVSVMDKNYNDYQDRKVVYEYKTCGSAGIKVIPYLEYFLYCYDRNHPRFLSIQQKIVSEIELFLKDRARPIYNSLN